MSGTRQAVVFFLFLFTATLWVSPAAAQSASNTGIIEMHTILERDRIYRIYADRYTPDSEALKKLNAIEDSVQLKVFFGNWCKESKKYIPGLIKTLQELNTRNIQAEFIAVDAQKKFPKAFLKKFDIKYIPTVVVLKGTVEAGRIEEIPQYLIETELVHILNKGIQKEKTH